MQRQQTKWIVLALVVALLIYSSAAFIPQGGSPTLTKFIGATLLELGLLLIPIAIGISILRYRLWDVDSLINKALVYGLLTGLLGALYAGLIIGLGSLAATITGKNGEQPVVLVIATLAVAALFQPVRHRIQAIIDRRFYRRKYDAEKTLAAFSAALRSEIDLNDLREQLLSVVNETMQPAHVSLWLRVPEPPQPLQSSAMDRKLPLSKFPDFGQ